MIFGRTLGDATLNVVVLVVMGLAGFIVGWRPDSGLLSVIAGFVLLLFFGYAMSWIGVLVGLSVRDGRAANGIVFIVVFPMTFLSNAFAPTTNMPTVLQYVAEWNPVSTMVAACRELFGLENFFGVTASSWPSQNPLAMSLIYMVIITVIFVPLSIKAYQRSALK